VRWQQSCQQFTEHLAHAAKLTELARRRRRSAGLGRTFVARDQLAESRTLPAMPAVGDVLASRYRVDAMLGAGGMATVYRATDLRLEREVAVKVLLPNLARDPALAERFDREARLLASVSHPNIAEVFDVEPGDPEAGREPFYVMELCNGGSLADRIATSGAVPPGELVPVILAVAAGLGELHRNGLIHRDVKPANILFTGGRPKLADFGLVRSGGRPEYPTLTDPGTAIGTPAYMAPELVSGGRSTTASDVYALGATTYHALTGRAPRQTETITGLIGTIADPVPAASTSSPMLGNAFDDLLRTALANEPGDRPTLNAFTGGLVGALTREEGLVGPAAHRLPPPGPPSVTPAASIGAAPVPVDPFAETAQIPVSRTVMERADRLAARPEQRSKAAVRPPRKRGVVTAPRVAAAIVAVVILVALLLGGGLLPGGATETPSTAPSPTPTATTTPSPSPTTIPSPTSDPAAAALAALDQVVIAIDQAKGGPNGLSGKDAGELLKLADEVRRHLEDEQFRDARAAAERLADRADKATKGVDAERAQRIKDAISTLIDAIPA
jgi:tRNA A-37 threonylcarbamoyl transferase component Bud32